MCKDNFIGVRACGDIAPKSGYYIDDLEGINLTAAADISVNSDAISFLKKKIDFAMKQTANDVVAKLPTLQFNTMPEELKLWCFSETIETAKPVFSADRNKYKSPLSAIQVNRIFVKLNEDFTGDLLVYDSGVLIDTINITVTEGIELCIEDLNYLIEGKLEIKVDTLLQSYVSYSNSCTWLSALGSCCSRPYESVFLDISDGLGVMADITVICSYDKILCRLLHPFKDAILYRSGIEILNEWLATDRVNFLAVNGREWAENKKAEWWEIYEAKVAFGLTSTNMQSLQKLDEVCFDCGGNVFGYAN